MAHHIPHVANGKGVALAVDQHEHHLGGDEYHHRQQVNLD